MNIPLETFELHFDEVNLLAGERIFDEGGVVHVQQLDKNLWVAEIADRGNAHEVELVLTRKNVKKATCECKSFLDKGICGHVVATLFKIRKNRTTPTSVVKKSKQRTSSSISLPSVLNSMNREELLEYLKNIARQRKDIANDIKLKYAYRVPHYQAKAKYQDILYSIFKPHIQKGSISINQAKSLFRLLSDLMDQATDFAALKQYEDSVYASLAAIQKINYLYRKIPEDKQGQFDDLLIDTFENIQFILSQDIAPKLFHEAMNELEELAISNYYQWRNINKNYIMLVWKNAWDEDQKIDFMENLLPELYADFDEATQIKYLALGYYLHIQNEIGSKFLTDKLENIETPQFRNVCKLLFPENPNEVYQLCGMALHKSKDWRLQKYCFDILSREPQNQEILLANMEIIHVLLAYTADLRIAEWLLEYDATLRDSVENIIDLVRRRQSLYKADQITIFLYYHLDLTDELIDLIVENIQVEHFRLFAPDALDQNPSKANMIFLTITEKYLDHHLGTLAYEKINSILNYLDNQGAMDIKISIEKLIKEKYAHRAGLKEQVL